MKNYNWTISALDCEVSKDGLSNVVETIHWRLSVTNEDGVSAETYGAQSVPTPNPESFTEFDSLNKETIVSWLEAVMDVEEKKTLLDEQLNSIINPKRVTLTLPEVLVEENI